ncbi:MAG: LysR family transcriptional regulator [Verrucomicrobia bacterium]|nr:LysR family transcriptional regulator [Verrucomicrobiota bacterium]
MELRHIRSFLSLAKTLNFSRTAEIVHLSQPALTLQIQALEEEMGVKLFERDRRKTALTAAGAAFQREASAGLAQLEQGIQNARLAAHGKLGVIRLGFVSTAGTYLIPNLINQYRTLNPLVEFSLRNILTADQGPMLEEGSIDLGFLRMPFATGPNLDVAPIHREDFVLVVPSSHALARKSGVRLRETANETYVLYDRPHAPGFHDFVLGILNRAGVIPSVSQVAGEMPTLISLVAAGAGISLLPVSAVKNSKAAVTGCKVRDKIPISEIALVWRKKAARAVVEQFKQFVLANARAC